MSNKKFTLASLVHEEAMEWANKQKYLHTVVGNLISHMRNKGKLREAQLEAIIVYLWLKEVGNNGKLSQIVTSGILFGDGKFDARYNYDLSYVNNNTKRFINRYMQDSDIRNYDRIMGGAYTDNDFEELLKLILDENDYTNYLFSLPMGTGKTFMIAAFIYIDMYLSQMKSSKKYAQNFVIIAPSAKKTAILPSLKTIRMFNPAWILPENKAKELKRLLKIEVLDDVSKNDKLQNHNPNQSKINRTINGHSIGNVFIINAEKILPEAEMIIDIDSVSSMLKTKVERAENIKESLSRLERIGLFLDEAHHTYERDNNVVKLRKQIDILNKYGNLSYCIGVSGTPYCKRSVYFKGLKIELEDIQDVVYYYPLTKGIGNFLKTPDIRKIDGDRDFLIKKACEDFFAEFDVVYSNGTKSKMAFYCPSIAVLNEEVLPLLYEWYDSNGRDKNEILVYYSDDKEYPLPKENKGHFLGLDNPTSKYRIILLVAIGTEGWDCRSLTAVCLPRQKNEKNFVLQTTCRCLREVDSARNERALVYLDESNYQILDEELAANYHLSISDITSVTKEYKKYPIVKQKDELGKLKYKNITYNYYESKLPMNDMEKELAKVSVSTIKASYSYENRIGYTKITEEGIQNAISYEDIENVACDYSFIDFIYDIEASSWGAVSCAELYKYRTELERIYIELVSEYTWFLYHPEVSVLMVAKEVAKKFSNRYEYRQQKILEDVQIDLLEWDMTNKPTVMVERAKDELTFPERLFDIVEGTEEAYEDDMEMIRLMYKRLAIANKEKSFNYFPYRMDSSYEHNFLKEVLARVGSYALELYYNGIKEEQLQSLRIKTPYGLYTPDFLCINRDKNNEIEDILLIEVKGKPYETEAKENFVKNVFIPENKNFDYIRVGNVKDDISELNIVIDKLKKMHQKSKEV